MTVHLPTILNIKFPIAAIVYFVLPRQAGACGCRRSQQEIRERITVGVRKARPALIAGPGSVEPPRSERRVSSTASVLFEAGLIYSSHDRVRPPDMGEIVGELNVVLGSI